MCGIVGYVGNAQAAPFLLDGMSKLEYRGYDSAGIAVYEKGFTKKAKSGLKNAWAALTPCAISWKAECPKAAWVLAIHAGQLTAGRLTATPIRIRMKAAILLLYTTALSKTT